MQSVKKTRNRILWSLFCLCQVSLTIGQSGFYFTENKGQWNEAIRFEADVPGGKFYIEEKGFTFLFAEPRVHDILHNHNKKDEKLSKAIFEFQALKVQFLGAKKQTKPQGSLNTQGYRNYFIGKDKSKWANKVQSFYKVSYPELYSGIRLDIYEQESQIKYDFVVAPYAKPHAIQMRYEGADDVLLVENKLFIQTRWGYIEEQKPIAWQWIKGEKVFVACDYQLNGNILSYQLGTYDQSIELIIDPILIFATYSGSTSDNFGFTATYDLAGNLYAGGNVTEPYAILPNGRYPSTAGVIQVNFAGITSSSGPYDHFPCDMAISKYDSSGSTLIWATYLGGTDNDYPHSLVVDKDEQLIILGSSYSPDFPTDSLAFDTTYNGMADIVVVKLNKDATELVGSTYLGGNDNDGVLEGALVYNFADNFRGDIYVDNNDDIWLASCSRSEDFPIKQNAFQPTLADTGSYDGVVARLSGNLRQLIWSSYFGGAGDDAFYSLSTDKSNAILVAGGTRSNNLPVGANAYQQFFSGGLADGMMLKFNDSSYVVQNASYFGTNAYDQVYFIDTDLKNRIYIFGQTRGNLSMSPGVYGAANRSQFITMFNDRMDSIVMQTTIGNRVNSPDFSPTAFLVDNCYNIYFAGWGSHQGFGHSGSTLGLEITSDAIQSSTDGNDFYLGVLDPGARKLIYATYFGGTQTNDHVDGGTSRFDKRGVVYHAICGSCPIDGTSFITDIPTTPNAVFPTNLSPRCSNATFKLDFQITYAVEANLRANPKQGCMPLDVQFTNLSKGTSFKWDFGDGQTSVLENPRHQYTQPGTYTVWLHITDSVSCNLTDSISTSIQVVSYSEPDFTFETEPCSHVLQFNNKSEDALEFLWIFDDGSTSKDKNPKRDFVKPGLYDVVLISNPGSECSDTLKKQILISDSSNSVLQIPNVFTPGNDALNNCFRISGLEYCDEVKVEIFNRWAQKVYESEASNFCWDGKHFTQGTPLPASTYYVMVTVKRFNGEQFEYKGTVALIRQ
jgi:gliding motility-associated-like protein